jgi:hypothetical protein
MPLSNPNGIAVFVGCTRNLPQQETSMTVVYHLAPKNLVGNTLQPMNALKESHPGIYAKYVQKYQGREQVIERKIPLLNCLWNDVLFFTSVHPRAIKEGFIAVGKQWKPQQWIEVDTVQSGFNAENTVIYVSDMTRQKGDFTLNPEWFIAFAAEKLITTMELPEATLAYYREAAENQEPIFAWRGLPHIMHQGSIDLDAVKWLEI